MLTYKTKQPGFGTTRTIYMALLCFFFYGFWYYQMGTKCEAGMHVRVHLGKYGETFFKKAESERVVVWWKEFVSDATEQEY